MVRSDRMCVPSVSMSSTARVAPSTCQTSAGSPLMGTTSAPRCGRCLAKQAEKHARHARSTGDRLLGGVDLVASVRGGHDVVRQQALEAGQVAARARQRETGH